MPKVDGGDTSSIPGHDWETCVARWQEEGYVVDGEQVLAKLRSLRGPISSSLGTQAVGFLNFLDRTLNEGVLFRLCVFYPRLDKAVATSYQTLAYAVAPSR